MEDSITTIIAVLGSFIGLFGALITVLSYARTIIRDLRKVIRDQEIALGVATEKIMAKDYAEYSTYKEQSSAGPPAEYFPEPPDYEADIGKVTGPESKAK